jgi:hypothetical protein
MNDEETRMEYYIDRIRTNNIIASDTFVKIDGDIEVNGNLKVKSIEEENQKLVIFDKEIEVKPNTDIEIDFKSLENEFVYNMRILFNKGEYFYQNQFIYNNIKRNKPKIITAVYEKYSIELKISEEKSNRLMIRFKGDIDLTLITSMSIKIALAK